MDNRQLSFTETNCARIKLQLTSSSFDYMLRVTFSAIIAIATIQGEVETM